MQPNNGATLCGAIGHGAAIGRGARSVMRCAHSCDVHSCFGRAWSCNALGHVMRSVVGFSTWFGTTDSGLTRLTTTCSSNWQDAIDLPAERTQTRKKEGKSASMCAGCIQTTWLKSCLKESQRNGAEGGSKRGSGRQTHLQDALCFERATWLPLRETMRSGKRAVRKDQGTAV